jgi:flagellar motor switch/type III secretory pathway protein FliN
MGEDEDGVIMVDLSGLVDLPESEESGGDTSAGSVDATEEQREELDSALSSGGDGSIEEHADVAGGDHMAAPSTPMAAAGSSSNAPLATPPRASDGEKVDTSKLDAELAKMKTASPGGDHMAAPSALPAQENNLPVQSGQVASNGMLETQKNLIQKQQNGGTSIMDEGKTGEPVQSEETNHSAVSSMDDDVAGNEEESSGEGISEDNAPENDEGNAEDNIFENNEEESSGEGVSGRGSESTGGNTAQAGNADTVNSGNGIDPQFAEKTVQDIHADAQAPQTKSRLAEQVQPLQAQPVIYEQPAVGELAKQPTLEKSTNIHSSVPVEKMPIVLTFETGRQKITIGELEKVKKGYTFECGNSINAPVTICANDTPIGTGELLDIDGRIGVRIIEFYGK